MPPHSGSGGHGFPTTSISILLDAADLGNGAEAPKEKSAWLSHQADENPSLSMPRSGRKSREAEARRNYTYSLPFDRPKGRFAESLDLAKQALQPARPIRGKQAGLR